MISLALMYVHRDTNINVSEIVGHFARRKPRKMILPNILLDNDDKGTDTEDETADEVD